MGYRIEFGCFNFGGSKIIFTTAYRKYVIEEFELDAVDYLLKPISFERFLKAVNKVLQTHFDAQDPVRQITESMPGNSPSCLYFRVDRKMVKVFLDEILYVEDFSDYIINTAKKTIVTKHLLSALEETLPRENFIRIHRSFIVSVNKIDSYHTDVIQIGDKDLPIGRLYKQNVINQLQYKSNHSSNGNK